MLHLGISARQGSVCKTNLCDKVPAILRKGWVVDHIHGFARKLVLFLLAETAGAEFAFEFPSFAVGFKCFADPVKRVPHDFGEAPASWRAV